MLVSLVYLLFRRALAMAALRPRSREFKELEIVVLRHQLAVLRRQVASNLVRPDGLAEAPQLELTEGVRIDCLFDSPEDSWADQDLTRASVRAETGGEVCHGSERAVVISAFEADPAERRVTRLDSDSETQLNPPLPPQLRQLRESLLGGERKPDSLELVLFDHERVVEEHHHAVAREVFERPLVRGNQLAKCFVVRAKHLEQLFRRSRLGERGETAKVAEETGDVGAVAGQQLFALLRRDELGDGRRDEAGQLRALPLDGVDQPRVGDRYGRLIGECPDELDVVVGEWSHVAAGDPDDPDQLLVQHDWNAEQGPISDDALSSLVRVVGVGQNVGDLLHLTGQSDSTDNGRPVTRVRMFRGVVVGLVEVGALREDAKLIAFRQIELRVLAATEPLRGLDDLVQYRLQTLRGRDRPKNVADRLPLVAQVLIVSSELLDVAYLALSHGVDFTTYPL